MHVIGITEYEHSIHTEQSTCSERIQNTDTNMETMCLQLNKKKLRIFAFYKEPVIGVARFPQNNI